MTRMLLFLALASKLGAQPQRKDSLRLYAEALRAWDAGQSGGFRPIESKRDAFILGFMVGVLSRDPKQVMAGEPSRVGLLAPREAMTRPPDITTTNTRPVGAEWSCTACEQPSEVVSMAPPAGGKQVSPTVIGVNAGVDQRAHLAGRDSRGGRGLAGRPSTGLWEQQVRMGKVACYQPQGRICGQFSEHESPSSPSVRPGWWKRHLGDSLTHLGGTSLDAASSWRLGELNPLLRSADGRFGARGLGIKLFFVVGEALAQYRASKEASK